MHLLCVDVHRRLLLGFDHCLRCGSGPDIVYRKVWHVLLLLDAHERVLRGIVLTRRELLRLLCGVGRRGITLRVLVNQVHHWLLLLRLTRHLILTTTVELLLIWRLVTMKVSR